MKCRQRSRSFPRSPGHNDYNPPVTQGFDFDSANGSRPPRRPVVRNAKHNPVQTGVMKASDKEGGTFRFSSNSALLRPLSARGS